MPALTGMLDGDVQAKPFKQLAFKRQRISILGVGAPRFRVLRLRCGHGFCLAHGKATCQDLRGDFFRLLRTQQSAGMAGT